MKRNINIFADKQYITGVTKLYIFFDLDGQQERVAINKDALKQVFNWYESEYRFYERMYSELESSYNKQKDAFNSKRHYYTDEEIKEACKINRFANIDMKISNEKYMRDWNYIAGIGKEASEILDKKEKYFKLMKEIKIALQ